MWKVFIAVLLCAVVAPAYSLSLPANNIVCRDFMKVNGNWAALGPLTLKLGDGKIDLAPGTIISPKDGGDLYEVITAKCATI